MAMGAGLAALMTANPAWAGRRLFASGGMPLGINIYMIAALFAHSADDALSAVAKIGFREVEAKLDIHPVEVVKAALDRNGLRCSTVGILPQPIGSGASLETDPAILAASVHALGAEFLTCTLFPLPQGVEMRPKAGENSEAMLARIASGMTAESWKRAADYLNAKGAGLKRHGVRFAYHNHNPELAPHGETNGLAILLEHTDPDLVCFEMDAGWIVAAGHDPVEVLRAYPSRFRLMHVKDIAPTHQVNTTFRAATTAVGEGVIDWPRVLRAALASGVRHFAIEQEPPYATAPIEAARRSFAYLSSLEI
jgi:sugar phosphate isomerase/epimerase